MKVDIHPAYSRNAQITCVCGTTYDTGSTKETVSIELCSNCHPFYTGKQKIVDTARRVEKFEARKVAKKETATGHKAKLAKKASRAKAREEKTAKAESK